MSKKTVFERITILTNFLASAATLVVTILGVLGVSVVIYEKSKEAQESVIIPQEERLITLVHRNREETQKSGDNKLKQAKKEANDIGEGVKLKEKPTAAKKTISGWCFLGRFNSKHKEWININIEKKYLDEDYNDRTPVKNDKVKLAKAVNLRTGKPRFPLYKMGSLLIPSLPRETVLTIKNIDNNVGINDYTWAEVELEWPTVP